MKLLDRFSIGVCFILCCCLIFVDVQAQETYIFKWPAEVLEYMDKQRGDFAVHIGDDTLFARQDLDSLVRYQDQFYTYHLYRKADNSLLLQSRPKHNTGYKEDHILDENWVKQSAWIRSPGMDKQLKYYDDYTYVHTVTDTSVLSHWGNTSYSYYKSIYEEHGELKRYTYRGDTIWQGMEVQFDVDLFFNPDDTVRFEIKDKAGRVWFNSMKGDKAYAEIKEQDTVFYSFKRFDYGNYGLSSESLYTPDSIVCTYYTSSKDARIERTDRQTGNKTIRYLSGNKVVRLEHYKIGPFGTDEESFELIEGQMKLDYKRIWISNNEVRTWNYQEGKLSGKTRTIYNDSGGIISSAYKKNGRWVELDMLSINSVVQNRCNSPVLVGTQTLWLDLEEVIGTDGTTYNPESVWVFYEGYWIKWEAFKHKVANHYKGKLKYKEVDQDITLKQVGNKTSWLAPVNEQKLRRDLKTVLPEQTSILIVEPAGFISKPVDVLQIRARTGDWAPQLIPFKM
jgi:hypothetical protein